MVQRQQGHPAEPHPTERFQPDVELRYLPPCQCCCGGTGLCAHRGGMLGVGDAAGTSSVLPSWGDSMLVKGLQSPKSACAQAGRMWGVPQHVGVCFGLQDHLPGETHSGAVLGSRQGTSACQATPMACIDIQIHAGLSFRCFFLQLLAFCGAGLAELFLFQLFQDLPLMLQLPAG